MTLRTFSHWACVAALVFSAQSVSAATVYSDEATNFAGQYRGVSDLEVSFAATGGHNSISFELFGTNSIDGFGNGWDDLFTVYLNSVKVFVGYFNMSGGGASVVTQNDLGWDWNTVTNSGGLFKGGVTSVSGSANLLDGLNTFRVSFTSPGPNNNGRQSLGDESWALNNLDVTPSPVPVPAALPLLAVALGGLGIASRRRRNV